MTHGSLFGSVQYLLEDRVTDIRILQCLLDFCVPAHDDKGYVHFVSSKTSYEGGLCFLSFRLQCHLPVSEENLDPLHREHKIRAE